MAFANLSTEESSSFDLVVRTINSLRSFFDDYYELPDQTNICLRCLEEQQSPLTQAQWRSVMITCGHNVEAAFTSITNSATKSLHDDLADWAAHQQAKVRNIMIDSLTSSVDFDFSAVIEDDRIQTWLSEVKARILDRLDPNMTAEATTDHPTFDTWAEAIAANAIKRAKFDAEQAYTKAFNDAQSSFENELTKYKNEMRLETDRRKDNIRKTMEAAVKGTSRNHPRAPPISTSSSRRGRTQTPSIDSRGPSRTGTPAHSRAPSPVRASSTTPKASPASFFPPSQALSEPLTDVSVGPPENSFESAMMKVDESTITANPLTQPHPESSGPPLLAAAPSVPNTQEPIPNEAPIPEGLSAFFSQLSSQMSSQFSSIENKLNAMGSRIDALERPEQYTPSALASAWAPPIEPNYTSIEPYVHDDQQSIPDVRSDTSDVGMGAPETDDPDPLELALRPIYMKHYNLQGNMSNEHNHVFRYEFYNSFTSWVDETQGGANPYDIVASLTDDHAALFFGWRIDTINYNAKYAPNKVSWQDRLNDISRALSLPDVGPVLSGPALTGKRTCPADPRSDGDVPLGTHNVERPRNNANPQAAPRCPPSPDGWVVTGKNGKAKSFAAAAAKAPTQPRPTISTPSVLPPKASDAFTKEQLQGMTNAQICHFLLMKYQITIRNRGANKASLIRLFLSKQAQANPIDLTSPTPSPPSAPTTANPVPAATSRPRARPANQAAKLNSEFTVLAHPAEVSMRAKKLPPDEIVRNLRTAMNQAHGGQRPLVTLLSGRWSSSLTHNFVLTFAGHPDNDSVYKYRSVLTSPFGPGARLIPQTGYTKVMIHRVPISRDEQGNIVDSKTLLDELLRNPSFFDLSIVVRPQWFLKRITLEKQHSSITVSFLDTDGSKLQTMIKNPPSLFGGLTYVEKYIPLPVIRGCDRCHALDHSVGYCNVKKGSTICPICAGGHRAQDHHFKCAGAPHNGSITCTCPPKCINCQRVKKSGNGHTALSPSCPLRKLYRNHTTRTGDSSEEERPTFARIVESPAPSSQPIANGVAPHEAMADPSPIPPIATHARVDDESTWGPKGHTWTAPALRVDPNDFLTATGHTISQMSDHTVLAEFAAFIQTNTAPVDPSPPVAQ